MPLENYHEEHNEKQEQIQRLVDTLQQRKERLLQQKEIKTEQLKNESELVKLEIDEKGKVAEHVDDGCLLDVLHEAASVGVDLSLEKKKEIYESVEALDSQVVQARIDAKEEIDEVVSSNTENELLLSFSQNVESSEILNNYAELSDYIRTIKENPITDENRKSILEVIKLLSRIGNLKSYELRSSVMRSSKGVIYSHEAYSIEDLSKLGKVEIKKIIRKAETWIEQRREIHEKIISTEIKKAEKLSERLDDSEPTIYILRGNTAAGKTFTVRKEFPKAIDDTGNISGAINPDDYKYQLRILEKEGGKHTITDEQVHNEGAMIASRIQEELLKKDISIIIDKRFSGETDVQETLERANGKKIRIIDIDSPLELSLIRVLTRIPGRPDPIPPFNQIIDGYKGVLLNRKNIINEINSNKNILSYVLYSNDINGKSTKIAEKENGISKPIYGYGNVYNSLIPDDTQSDTIKQETSRIGEIIITDEYLKNIKERLGYDQEKIKLLELYRGKTLKDAINKHSKIIEM